MLSWTSLFTCPIRCRRAHIEPASRFWILARINPQFASPSGAANRTAGTVWERSQSGRAPRKESNRFSNHPYLHEREHMKDSSVHSVRRFLSLVVFLFTLTSVPAGQSSTTAQSETTYQVAIENSVRIKMRDGVFLVADVYRPKVEGRFPVLLERTPYDRNGESSMAFELASHGYVVVLQDTRGRYESGGVFYPFRDESLDGFDTIEWAAKLDYADGKVGMFGGSYVGATQMLAAMAKPPHLVSIFPFLTGSDYYDGWTYQSGVLMQWFTSSWTSILAVDTLRRQAEEK